MLLKEMQTPENTEMLKQSLIRGKLMSVIAQEKNLPGSISEYYFTGIFSQIDAILNKDLGEILTGLPLTGRVKQALLGEPNELREMLDCVISFEKGAWNELAARRLQELVSPDRFMHLFIDAVKWVKSVGEF
jgi:EAL and modified HD-GYP domain-containing signal transduction protein